MNLKRTLLIFTLVVISFPAGYLTGTTSDPYTFRSEPIAAWIVGGIACMIVLGALSLLVYAFFRKPQPEKAFKRATRVYLFFAVIMSIVGLLRLPGVYRKIEREEFLEFLRPVIDKNVSELVVAAGPGKSKDRIATCVFYDIKNDKALTEILMEQRSPSKHLMDHPTVKQYVKDCLEMYKKDK